MELLIVILLILITYFVADTAIKFQNSFKHKVEFDPDFPYYSEHIIWFQKVKMDTTLEGFNKEKEIYEAYWEANKKELLKVKKNKEHSDEFKSIMSSYFYYQGEYNKELNIYRRMIEINYAIKNSKMTFKDVEKENSNYNPIGESGYDKWINYESK